MWICILLLVGNVTIVHIVSIVLSVVLVSNVRMYINKYCKYCLY